MECMICLDHFDAEVRRPKVLPCGHTHCLACLKSMKVLRCSACNKDFQSPTSLPDNFTVLSLVDKVGLASQEQDPGPLLARLQDAETCCSSRIQTLKSLLQETLPRVLQESLIVVLQVRMQLEGARVVLEAVSNKTSVELEDALGLGHALKLAEQALATYEAMPGLSELPGDGSKVSLVMDLTTGVTLRGGGSRVAVQQAVMAVHLLLDGGLEADGSPVLPPAASVSGSGLSESILPPNDPGHMVNSIAAAAVPVSYLSVEDLSQTLPQDRSAEKEEVLQRVRPAGVRVLIGVHCNKDPNWTMELLRCVKPAVERLYLKSPLPMHLVEVFAMPKLEMLCVFTFYGDNALLRGMPPLVAVDSPSSLRRLKLCGDAGLPRDSVYSLLSQHSATLQKVWLQVGTPGNQPWPWSCENLHSWVEPLNQLTFLVLDRNYMRHTFKSCKDQLSLVREKVPLAIVLCSLCDRERLPKKLIWSR